MIDYPGVSDLGSLTILVSVGCLAGFLNTIAGGGSMLSLPTLLFLNLTENEPKFLIDVAEEVARLRQQTKESIVKSSYENSLNFFNLHR